ncbi:MAG: amidohydrolase [Firmicutes bacterium]|nr:amidohydrolase [Bacillota bacterium]
MTQLEEIKKYVSENAAKSTEIADKVWEYAELPFEETRSAELFKKELAAEGFEIEDCLAGIPTAFLAKYVIGSGKPVFGLLAEYDALSGLSQKAACPVKDPIVPGAPGHGCGHNLLGAGCFSAALAARDYMKAHDMDGTVIFFGCPAEEGAGSKQFIARAGYFDDVDFCYTWHPSMFNEVGNTGSVAIMGANFIFDGIASHAGGSPHLGRSALDAAELMNIGVQYLREHMIDQARVHYAYSNAGGTAPNVVQDHTVIKYEVRAPKVWQMKELFERVVHIAHGAAEMTETTMHYDITMAFSDYIANAALAECISDCLVEAGAPEWDESDYKLAGEVLSTFNETTQKAIRSNLAPIFEGEDIEELLKKPLHTGVFPYERVKNPIYKSGSTDVGDVAYATPTVMINVATQCLGNVGHSWQNTCFSGSRIGIKGMLRAAEVMTMACVRTAADPELIAKAKAELFAINGGKYECPLPDSVEPPVGKY